MLSIFLANFTSPVSALLIHIKSLSILLIAVATLQSQLSFHGNNTKESRQTK